MAFRNDTAAATLSSVLDELTRAWEGMSRELRETLNTLIRAHGPQIADGAVDRYNVLSRISGLLDALWQLQARMPAQAVRILQAGQRAEASFRGITVVSDATRVELLEKMSRIVDFRVFDDPRRTAAEVDDLVDRFQERLSDEPAADRQVSERVQWQAYHAALAAGGDPADYLRKVEALLGEYPAVRQLLESHKQWTAGAVLRGVDMGSATPKGALPPNTSRAMTAGPSDGAAAPVASEVSRYANVTFPSKVLITQQMVPLVIHVAGEYQATGVFAADQARMTLKVGDLTVVIFAQDFDVALSVGGKPGTAGAVERMVEVSADRDCEPLVFFLNPKSAGKKQIQISFRQFGRELLTLPFQTEVVTDAVVLQDLANVAVQPEPIVSSARGKDAPPPDLELRVMLSPQGTELHYYLHSPARSDYNYKPVGGVDLRKTPADFFKPLFNRLSTAARLSNLNRTPDQTQAMIQDLADMGHILYDNLFPESESSFKAEYGKFRQKYRGEGLMITSDDPWIPWEIVRPYLADQDGNVIYDDPPLCEMFQLSRWLAGRGAPDQVGMARGVWVAPAGNLQAAQQETDYFTYLNRREWQVSMEGPLSTLADVNTRFRGGSTDLYHFACHGNFNTDDPNESKLQLAGDFLRPSQIVGPSQAGLRKARPLVFLNACYGGQVGVGLTQLAGWAQRFMDSGACVFIGSLWAINDQLAAQFAQEFYNRLWGVNEFDGKPQPLGQAFHEARLAIKAADEANPTWLAYVLYGDPYGHVVLGKGEL
jgi:hypothetical protein